MSAQPWVAVDSIVPLVLASASPRRIDMLKMAAVPHAVWPVDLDESPLVGETAAALVARLSQAKADAAALRAFKERGRESPVLAADTMVTIGGALLGKPPHEGAARQMMLMLSGATHQVLTGYHLRYLDHSDGSLRRVHRVVTTDVCVRALTTEEITAYLRSEEWRGKAGGYAIQGRFGSFIQSVQGSYDNVVGLPLCQVLEDLRAAGLLPESWPTWNP